MRDYLSINSSDASLPLGTCPQGGGHSRSISSSAYLYTPSLLLQALYLSIYLSIYISDTSSPHGNLSHGGGHSRVFKHSPPINTSLSQVLLHPVLPSSKWSFSSIRTLKLVFINLHTLLMPHPLNMAKPLKSVSLHPLHHSTIHPNCTCNHTASCTHTVNALPLPSSPSIGSSQLADFYSMHS